MIRGCAASAFARALALFLPLPPLLALLAFGACSAATGPIDARALEARFPKLSQQRGHRLAELGPHFWIAGEELLEFICLWPAESAIVVELASSTTELERRVVERALAALSPVVRREFDLRRPSSALPQVGGGSSGIQVEFIDGPDAGDPARTSLNSGDATADCGVDLAVGAAFAGSLLPARLVGASVRVRRARSDALGRVRPLDEVELSGALLHELGHALGFSTHTQAGDSLMRLAPIEVRRLARTVVAGRPLEDATLAAMYELESGVVTARAAAPIEAITTLRVFAMLAAQGRWSSPRTRAGVRSAELWWATESGSRVALLAARPQAGAAWSLAFRLRANSAGREVLRAN